MARTTHPRKSKPLVPGESDLIAYLRAAQPPEREAGEYTIAETSMRCNIPHSTATRMLKRAVKCGDASSREAVVVDAMGKRIVATVYKLTKG